MKKTTKVNNEEVQPVETTEIVPENPPAAQALELKAAAYDLQVEINRLTGILNQVQQRIASIRQQ